MGGRGDQTRSDSGKEARYKTSQTSPVLDVLSPAHSADLYSTTDTMSSPPTPAPVENQVPAFDPDIPAFDPSAPIDAEAPVEVDNDAFSDYGESLPSETQSLTSSLQEYIEKNGRRYHSYYGPDKNPMPNDDKEMSRLDTMHELILLATGSKLYQAPLDARNLHNVLDLGTGSGIWAIDFAQQHPQASVLGIDLRYVSSWKSIRLEAGQAGRAEVDQNGIRGGS